MLIGELGGLYPFQTSNSLKYFPTDLVSTLNYPENSGYWIQNFFGKRIPLMELTKKSAKLVQAFRRR